MAGKGGGAWKVAYADFVTAMMAFFLVMWITAQNKPVKEAIAQYFNDPTGTSSKASSSNTMLPTRRTPARLRSWVHTREGWDAERAPPSQSQNRQRHRTPKGPWPPSQAWS